MSHFYTIVLVNEDCDNIEREVANLLTLYDENMEVKPYVDIKIEELKKEFEKAYDEALNNKESFFYEKRDAVLFCKDYKQFADWYHGEGVYDKQGNRLISYNPNSKWDWWEIGGRWDGIIRNNRQSSKNGFNFNEKHYTLNNNTVKVEQLINDCQQYPFAIVAPDGEWYEKGKMGWWACVADEKEKDLWEKQCREVFEKYKDCFAVGCDLHI